MGEVSPAEDKKYINYILKNNNSLTKYKKERGHSLFTYLKKTYLIMRENIKTLWHAHKINWIFGSTAHKRNWIYGSTSKFDRMTIIQVKHAHIIQRIISVIYTMNWYSYPQNLLNDSQFYERIQTVEYYAKTSYHIIGVNYWYRLNHFWYYRENTLLETN